MKRKIFLFFLILLGLLVLSACVTDSAAVQSFVQLPENVKVGITDLVALGVAWLFVQIATLWPWLNGLVGEYKEPIALGIAGFLIDAIQTSVPDAYGGVAVAGLVLLLAIFDLVKKLSAKNVPGFRAR